MNALNGSLLRYICAYPRAQPQRMRGFVAADHCIQALFFRAWHGERHARAIGDARLFDKPRFVEQRVGAAFEHGALLAYLRCAE